jgi:oxygen-independent coproporphyrinogen-3 oxidase
MARGAGTSSALLTGLRRLLAGDRLPLRFNHCADFAPPQMAEAGLYVHVPFCRSLCPYCPYVRGPYHPALADTFCEALEREAAWYAGQMPSLRVGSVYFGGGTPTVLGGRLQRVVDSLRRNFAPAGPLCIETNPSDLDAARVRMLAALGFESVSLGVQSFDARTLAFLGRGYTPLAARRALGALAEAGIPSINMDLMFAIPGQAEATWQRDIEAAIASPATQVTAYPLFTFPYSDAGERRALHAVEMPPWRSRRRMYYQLYDTLTAAGFRRVSVWSFQRAAGHRFSSVTRRRYLGLGPSGGSCYGSLFTLNTFSLTEYARSVAARGHAVALDMPMSETTDRLMELYWHAYDTRLTQARWRQLAGARPRLRAGLAAARALGLCRMEGDDLALTRRGSFWIHLLQNQAVLPDVSRLWQAGKHDPWPEAVTL